MPIYEFKCLECEEYFEMLMMKNEDQAEMKCPKCESESFERILSTMSYAMGAGAAGAQKGASSQTRNCSSGSCTTYEIPGPTG
ncbi:MAG: zinc ribbon domain-containing protein [Desulfobacterales bacterium]|nr:zinc ribbon domain-containing protein [Desulfobacterales bacterium]